MGSYGDIEGYVVPESEMRLNYTDGVLPERDLMNLLIREAS